jgi:hypothetical protein
MKNLALKTHILMTKTPKSTLDLKSSATTSTPFFYFFLVGGWGVGGVGMGAYNLNIF